MPLKGRSFGQERPPLTEILKNILLRYPDGGQILKEIIQNADDAGASEVKFLFDATSYGTSSLVSTELACFQGPALYCYNNAVFTEEDWDGLQRLMRSNKKDNPLKVGRFGIGFNSIYHITDLPSIVSGDTVAFLDPHEKYFVRGEPGQAFSMQDPLLTEYYDQFEPFHGIFDCNLKQGIYFKGTLFRFPLRIEPSQISTKLYTKPMVKALFESFENEASVILHFLKSVDCISLYEREIRGIVSRLYTVKVSDKSKIDALKKRKELTKNITSDWDFTAKSVFYTLEIEEQRREEGSLKRKWFMANQVGCEDKHLIALGKELKLLPWVGIAFPVDANDHATFRGRIFCFLPLPPDGNCRTGLPVQVNGYFGLTDNRRALKWPGPDCLHDDTAQWNQLLMQKVGSSVYASLIENMIHLIPEKTTSHAQLVYSAFPRLLDVKQDWQCLLEPFCTKILTKEIFYTAAANTKSSWIKLGGAILDRLDESSETSKEVKEVVLSTLLRAGQPVVTLPTHVLEMVDMYFQKSGWKIIRNVTPHLLRTILRNDSRSPSTAIHEKLLLLEYVLQDTPENAADLQLVPLLPLENGEFCTFQPFTNRSSSSEKIFIASEKHKVGLLPNAKHRLLRDNLPQRLKQKLLRTINPSTQLFHLNRDDVKQLLWQNLPPDWSPNHTPEQQMVAWRPGEQSHPSVAWLPLVWEWITEQYASDVSEFEGMPLIPLSVNHATFLARLRRHSSVILVKHSMSIECLPLTVSQLLTASSCVVVEELPTYIKHNQIFEYVAPPTPAGLLKVLSVAREKVLRQLRTSSADVKNQLRSMLSKLRNLSADQASLILTLPIFQAIDGDNFIACYNNKVKLPVAPPNFALPKDIQILDRKNIISSSDEETSLLLKRLGMKVETTGSLLMSRLQRYLTCSTYSEQEKNKLMIWILGRMEILNMETRNFNVFLRQLAFVSTDSGTRRAPGELFDHSDELLRKLLLGNQDAFPAKEFAELMRKRKSDLGVRCRSNLTGQDLLTIITNCSSQNRLTKGKALLELINQRPSLLTETLHLDGSLLKDKLCQIAWLPRVLCRPDNYPDFVQWHDGSNVCKPIDMRPSSVALLVGASVPLFDERLVNKEVQGSLGLSKSVKLSQVVHQLRFAVHSWDQQQIKPSSMRFVQFQILIKSIYSEFSKSAPCHVKQLLVKVQLSQWVWHGSGFASPEKVALLTRFPKNINLNPHLFLLPGDFHTLKDVLLRFGVKKEFTDDDLLSVLWSIKARHDNTKQNPQDTVQDLDLCRVILEWIVRDGRTLSENSWGNLLIPVQTATCQLRLEPCNKCTYCDREFLRQGGSEINVTIDSHLIHKAIPDQLASSLGVPRLSSCLVRAQPLGYVIEEAGQYEPITTRLRNILEQYKEGVAIFKEMIQNADDAGASKVCFVVDWRESPRVRLLSDELAKCQGPALWAYNNAMFSKKDFENINKLAGETKKADLDKIGRFGLGFNAVYHLTDVPSFISGENFVVFDPNMTHIAKLIDRASRSGGMMINLATSTQVLSLFPDQFLPYHDLFGCNTKTTEPGTFSFDGTLFRFPFRTLEQARQSEICQDPYNREHVSHILESLKNSSSTLLLFAQNVKHVRVFEIPNDSDPIKALGEPIINISKEVVKVLHSNHADRDGKGTFLRNCSNWLLNERSSGYELEAFVGPRRTEMLKIAVSVKESKLGNTAEATKQQDTWLVNSCTGSGTSLRVAISPKGGKHGVLPITGAAVKISYNKPSIDELAHVAKIQCVPGEVFCFLPLSIASGLPVHINGCFSVYSNRRRLWEEGLGEHESFKPFEALWNEALMEDALAQVYFQLLEEIKSHTGKQYVFHSLWPDPTAISNTKAWRPFINAFFNKIIDEEWALFHCNREWRALRDCLILDPKLSKVSECLTIMNILSENVLSLPEVMLEAFRSSGKTTVITQHTLTEDRFLREYFFPNVAKLPNELRDSVLCHVLDRRLSKHHNYDDLWRKYACISCSKDNKVLRKASDLVHPKGQVACLFSEEEKKFPIDERFLTKERAMMLEDLGMVVDCLSWDGLCGRADWISSRCNKERQRAGYLVQYLNRYRDASSNSKPTTEHKGRLAAARFLPILEKPQEYPFHWKANELEAKNLFAANVLYSEQLKFLVGSSQLILDESSKGFGPLNQTLKGILGLDSKQAQLSDVFTQLDNVIQHVSSTSLVSEKIQTTCSAIYNHFKKIATSEKHKSKWTYLRSELQRRPWILVKDQMITPNRVAMRWNKADGSPYLYSLPDIYIHRYLGLIKWYRVKEKFSRYDFLDAIWELREDADGKKLSDQQLSVFLVFLSEICDNAEGDLTNVTDKPIPLPSREGILHDAAELAMNDAPWIETDGSIQYVHAKIPKLLAYKCGAKELRNAVLSNCSVPIGQPFGQNELLTDRLNGILKSYPQDEGILKELVQNADDAKAKDIHFVFDPRAHESQRVFSDKWKELQGPAICVYNDQTFSKDDIQGIQNLGIGSKTDDAEKTGQYGIGFNAVYHLTDCPCFLSDDNVICVSDPHRFYVPGATVEKPGRLYNQLGEAFRRNFQDVFSGFLGEFFTLEGATMFRFPLRRPGGLQSEISKKFWNETEIRELLEMFRLSAKRMLLFLNHVTKISISEIKEGKLETYSVLCAVTDDGKRSQFSEKIKEHKKTATHEIPWHVIHYTMNISDTNNQQQDWLVSQSFGCSSYFDDSSVPDGRRMGLLPRAGVAARLPSPDLRYVPVRCNAFCFLPLPVSTNLPVHVNGHFALDSARRDLWHDPKNADDRMLWNEFLKRQVIAPAYASLISEARGLIKGLRRESSSRGLFSSEKEAEVGLTWYHGLFPHIDRVDDKWKAVGEALYKACLPYFSVLPVAQSVPERKKKDYLFPLTKPEATVEKPVQIDWYNVAEVYFCPCDRWDSWSLEWSLLNVGIPLLSHTPECVSVGFKPGGKAKEISPVVVTEFLRHRSLLKDQLPKNIKDTVLVENGNVSALISYCSKDESFFENLQGVPLLLTQDEVLRCFSIHASVFRSRFNKLVPSKQELFIHEEIRSLFVSNIKKCSGIVEELDVGHLSKFKDVLFPTCWTDCATHQPWNPSGKDDSVPTKEWLELLWEFIHDVSSKSKENEILESIATWPIIPTTQNCLVPVSMSKTVLNVSSFLNTDGNSDKIRRELLIKLGCPELHHRIIPRSSSSYVDCTGAEAVLKHYLALIQSAKDVLGLLDHTLSNNVAQMETKLSNQEIECLLMFLQSDVSSLAKSLLLKLPFYKTIAGDYTRLSPCRTAYEVPNGLPLEDLHVLSDIANCVFLHQAPKLRDLYEYIDIQQATSVYFYLRIVLKYFNHLTPVGRERHLIYIRDTLLAILLPKPREYKQLISALKELSFIPDQSGTLHRVCEFYDPQNKVFAEFLPKERFPPKPFDSEDWRDFLHKVGLKSIVTEELFLEYATQIQREVSTAKVSEGKVMVNISQVLVSYLFENSFLHDHQFLQKISNISFVPAAKISKKFLDIHPAYAIQYESDKTKFISFQGSVTATHVPLVWSSAPLLSGAVTPIGEYRPTLVEELKIHTKPPIELVVSHAKNISGRFHQTKEKQVPPNLRFSLPGVLDNLYDYFKNCCKVNSARSAACSQECETACNALRDVPIVLVDGHTLVRGTQLSFRGASKTIQPYMFEVPRHLNQYEHFLKRLGAQEYPTPLQYAKVLQAIKDSCKDSTMHPGECSAARSAMVGLFLSLKRARRASQERGATTTYNESQSLATVTVLYLPTQDGHLKPSTEIVVNDTMEQKDRLKEHWKDLLVDFTIKDQEPPDKLVELLPSRLKVQKLSSKVREELNPNCIDKVCVLEMDTNQGTCEFIQRYRHIMCSPQFSNALVRLYKFQENISKVPEDVQKNLKAMETRLTISCMQAIQTRLVSMVTGESIPQSEKDVGCFYESNGDGFRIMIKHGGEKNNGILHNRLATFIHKITGGLLEEGKWRFLMVILGLNEPSVIASVLDEARIPRSVNNNWKEPCPGEIIPEHFHVLLKNDIDYHLREDELVGYEVKEEDEDNDAVYVYAKIIEQTNEGEGKFGFDSRYKIDIGEEEPIEVSKLKLYKFDREGTKAKKKKEKAETSSTDLVLYEGGHGAESDAMPAAEEQKTSSKPCTLEEAKKEVAEALAEIWNLPESDRAGAIRRLIKRWHPDKNPDCESLANEVTKFLFNEVERLKKGGVPGYREPGSQRPDRQSDHNARPRSHNTWDVPDFSEFFRSHQRRARRDRQRYDEWQGRSRGSTSDTEPANKKEAERWMRQAREDLNAAMCLFQSQSASLYTFTCFHCQQAVEKCLKAVLFAKGRIETGDLDKHEVMSLAYRASTEDETLRCLPMLVIDINSYYLKTRYPDYNQYFPQESIPSEMFTQQHADGALSKAREILQLIGDVLNE